MQIPKEFLAEKNYEGSRLIEVSDPKVTELQGKLKELQVEANPYLAKMEDITKVMDPLYTELRDAQAKVEEIKKKLAPHREKYDKEMAFVETIDQKAQVIKNKLQPLVLKLVAKDLGEFEKALQLSEKDGKMFVEIVDEVEEKVKAVRASKAKN